jgi:hypothetical protein
MGNTRHVRKLRQGAEAWNAWRVGHPGVVPDLRGLSLPVGRRRFGPSRGGPIDLRGADLRGAALAGADLARACMVNADLTGADLRGASLAQADLDGALLDGANLSGAWLGGARNLTQAQVDGAEGQKATVLPTNLEMPRAWVGEVSASAGAVVSRRGDAAGAAGDDPYAILGVSRKSSAREVRAAYLSLVKKLHPDGRAADPSAHDADERLRCINDAYRELRAPRGGAGGGARRWKSAGRAATVFMAGLMTAAAPVLVALTIGFYWAGWFGPQETRTRTAALRHGARDVGPVETGAISELRKHTESGRQAAWSEAESLGTKEGGERFIAAYPDGQTAQRAREAIAALDRAEERRRAEAEAWAAARKSGDRDALQRFAAAYPDSANAALAREAVAALDRAEKQRRAEAEAWAAAEKGEDREALQRFAAAHPDGANAQRAREAIAALAAADARREADLAAWAAAERDGARAALRRYLADHPEGGFADEARRRVAALEAEESQKDETAWAAAVRRNSKAAYAGYLTTHPNGRHAADARVRMADLERVEAKAQLEPVKAPASRPPPRETVAGQRWPAADEPFVGADGRIRR